MDNGALRTACNRYGGYLLAGMPDVLRQLRVPARDKWNSMQPGKLEAAPVRQAGAHLFS